MKRKIYDEGLVFMQPNEDVNELIFIEKGIVEVYAFFEGNKFVIDNLG